MRIASSFSIRFGYPLFISVAIVLALPSAANAYSPVLRTIDSTGDTGVGPSASTLNGYYVVSYIDQSNKRPKLWYDDGRGGGTAGDFTPNGGEVYTLDNTFQITPILRGTALTVLNDRLAVCYHEDTNHDLFLWYDDGRGGGTADDQIINGTEVRTIEAAGLMGYDFAITTRGGMLAVASHDGTNEELHLWYDDGDGGGTAGDALVNGSEIRVIDTSDLLGLEISITVVNGNFAIAYQNYSTNHMKLWYDDGDGGGTAGDGHANGSEVRTIDNMSQTGFYTTIMDFNGRIALGFYDFDLIAARLWYDDGRGGGTDGDGYPNGSEMRTIDNSNPGCGIYNAITQIHGRLAMCYAGNTDTSLNIWYDDGNGGGTADNQIADGSEVRYILMTPQAFYSSIQAIGTTLFVSFTEFNDVDLELAMLEVAASPDAPASLGPTALVTGGLTTSAAAAMQFTLSDPNTSDMLEYRIQVDDSSDFSSPVVDYTSAAAAQGAKTFTVGQSAGSGSYAVGSASQTLPIGSYYWRVRGADDTDTSAWVTANGGAVAFLVMTTPSVTTATANTIAASSAMCGGNVTATGGATVTARGVCWSTSHNPTTADSHTSNGSGGGSFTSAISGLSPGTLYYYRGYATNAAGTSYGGELSFTTAATTATVTTANVSAISITSAMCGGNVTATGGPAVTARGVCWSTSQNPTVAGDRTTDGSGTGAFTSALTGLSPETVYYLRSYATNSVGVAYGSEVSFTTDALPPVELLAELAIDVSVSQVGVEVGDEITFDIVVENTGDADAIEIVLTAEFPPILTLLSAESLDTDGASLAAMPDVSISGNDLTATIDSLPQGESIRVRLIAQATADGVAVLIVEAVTDDPDIAAIGQSNAVIVTSESTTAPPAPPVICGTGFLPMLVIVALALIPRRR